MPTLVPPLRERWRRAPVPTLLGHVVPEVVGDTALVADPGGVYALSADDGSSRWAWTLADADPPPRADTTLQWIRAVPDGFVVAAWSPSRREARLFGLSAAGKVRWGHTRISDGTSPGPLDGHELGVTSRDGPRCDLLAFHAETGAGRGERLPEGLDLPTRCAKGWLYRSSDEYADGEGLVWRPDGSDAYQVWAGGVVGSLAASGDFAFVTWAVPRQKERVLAAYTVPTGGELWRADGTTDHFDVSDRGVTHFRKAEGAFRPRLLDRATGAVRWEGAGLTQPGTPIDARGVIVCTTTFEVRTLDPDTGATLQSFAFADGLSGHDRRTVTDGRLMVVQDDATVVCFADRSVSP